MTEQTMKVKMSIVTALIQIIKQVKENHLTDTFWKNCETHLAFLRGQLDLTDMQIVFVALLLEDDNVLDWDHFAIYLDYTSFEMRTHAGEFDELIKKGWITKETTFCDGMGFKLTEKAKTALTNNQAFVPEDNTTPEEETSGIDEDMADIDEDFHMGETEDNIPMLKKYTDIAPKSLYFNPQEQEQVKHLTSILKPRKFASIQRRLDALNMRKGFACLFYGGPGTGKTETVLQIARQTGRDIMQVEIAGLRGKMVGESISNVKRVFNTYRELCEVSDVAPILFFNEADGIFTKRSLVTDYYCEKEENAMQNVILQEMENLEGILIATTNLMSNLDNAFERRFLYKIEFNKPTTEVKAKIWSSMLGNIRRKDALHLATQFDISGGQIENIARKCTVDYILSGKYANLSQLEDYCRAEIIDNKKERHRIAGFQA